MAREAIECFYLSGGLGTL